MMTAAQGVAARVGGAFALGVEALKGEVSMQYFDGNHSDDVDDVRFEWLGQGKQEGALANKGNKHVNQGHRHNPYGTCSANSQPLPPKCTLMNSGLWR